MSDLTRRIFIDSRHKLPGSASNGDFQVELPFAVNVPSGTQVFIDNLVLSHSWPTVSAANCNLFLKETLGNVTYHRLITIANGQYNIGTLTAELQAKLRSGSYITDGVYTVTHSSNRIQIETSSPTASIYIYSRKDMTGGTVFNINWPINRVTVATSNKFNEIWTAANVVSPSNLPSPLADATEMIGLMTAGAYIQPNVPFKLQHVDLARNKSLYLCSNDLGESTTLDLRGNTSIIRKINVGHTTQGDVIVDTLQSNVAFSVYRTGTMLKHLAFQLRDFNGDVMTFYDHQITFEIILLRPTD